MVLATGGYGNVYFLSTNAMSSNVTATWRAYRRGACFANPCFVQIHPTCIPVHGTYQSKLTLMSESLRNDGRVWVPGRSGDKRPAAEDSRNRNGTIFWKPNIRASAIWCPGTWPPETPRSSATSARGSAKPAWRSISISPMPSAATGRQADYPQIRQPLSDVREDHRQESAARTDGDLSGGALHHGRPVGGLQPDEHHRRALCPRRGQFLRPRRQPARRQRPDAGIGRRLFHPAQHHQPLPGRGRECPG